MKSVLECIFNIDMLLEGGLAFSGVRPIKQSEVRPTFSQFEKQVFHKLGLKGKVVMIGSAVPLEKKEFGDIDTAIDDKDINRFGGWSGFLEKLKKLKFSINPMPGLKLISIKFPIFDSKNKQTRDFVQVDIMTGKRVWLEFWAFTLSGAKYKSVYKNILMQAVFRLLNQIITHDPSKKYSLSHLGLRLKDIEEVPITRGPRKGEMKFRTLKVKMLTNTPKGMVKTLNELTNANFEVSDFNSFEILIKALKKNLKKNFYNAIVEEIRETLKKQGFIVPDEIEK